MESQKYMGLSPEKYHVNVILLRIKQLSCDLHIHMPRRAATQSLQKWVKPSSRQVKFNVDGSLHTSTNWAGIGGVVCNEQGPWLWGFANQIQASSATIVELQALKLGLEQAWERNI